MEADPQRRIAFEDADAAYKERENDIALALLRADADLHLATFVFWVFRVTGGGVRGELRKSHEELASRPRGLCCSREKAKATVRLAKHLGLITVEENLYATRGQAANSYRIDWRGCRDLINGANRRGSRASPPGTTDPPPGLIDPPPGLAHPPIEKSINYYSSHTLSLPLSDSESEGPRRKTDAAAEKGDLPRDDWPAWLAEVPELAEARPRTIAPLDPGGTRYGAFSEPALKEFDLGESSLWVIGWFRRQIASPRPVTGANEAELLLVIAAAKAVLAMRAAPEKSHVAVWSATVGRRLWHKVLGFVPEARLWLDRVLARFPDALVDPSGRGAPRSTEAARCS